MMLRQDARRCPATKTSLCTVWCANLLWILIICSSSPSRQYRRRQPALRSAIPAPPDSLKQEGHEIKFFAYVGVPCDITEPMQEYTCGKKQRRYFTRRDGREEAWMDNLIPELRERLGAPPINKTAVVQSNQTLAPPIDWDEHAVVDSDQEEAQRVQKFLQNQSFIGNFGVGSLGLLTPSNTSNSLGVSMYYDDRCLTKRLPFNQRATNIAMAAGDNTKIHGDAFISRFYHGRGSQDCRRINFTLKDCSSDAEWVKQARLAAEKRLKESEILAENGKQGFGGRRQTSTEDRVPPNMQFKSDDLKCEKDEERLGGVNNRFQWTQTRSYASISVNLPPGTSKNDIRVDFKPDVMIELTEATNCTNVNMPNLLVAWALAWGRNHHHLPRPPL